jgi:PKD repeat protein
MRKALLLCALFLIVATGFSVADDLKVTTVARLDIPSFVGYVPNQIIVKFKDISTRTAYASPRTGRVELGVATLDGIATTYGVTEMVPLFQGAKPEVVNGRVLDLSRHHRITFDASMNLDDVLAAYRSDPNVESVEPIGIHTVLATPNDGTYPSQWHLNRANDHDIDAPEAWNIETGDATIIAAMLDTGVRYFHKDLGGSNASYSNPTAVDGNMWINWTEKNGTAGVDDDGNGYVDDWVGYDFVSSETGCWSGEDCSTKDNDPRDFNGHGTHCAGNLAAINNNGYATCSASGGWLAGSQQPTGNGIKVMACRVGWSGSYLGSEVGYVRMDYAAEALTYAANKGAKIASCSWGSSNSGGIAAAIDYFVAHGGLVFKAAGNDGSQTADYMCGRSDVISVAATDSSDCKANFSTYGTWVDISAPGTGIYSLYHYHADAANDYVASMDGTSMATPIAASVAALIWSQNPTWTATQVRDRLFATADPINGLACNSAYSGKLGAGRVNAYNAVYGGGNQPPVAAFVGAPTSGVAPLTVQFTDQSTGSPTGWAWNFGDGGTATTQNPSHVYSTTGTYTVTLTATNSCGSNQLVKASYITVSEPPAQQCDDFADGDITNWVNKSGTWTATGGYMKGNSNTTAARTTSPFGSYGVCTVDCDVRMNTTRTQRKARVIFAYVDGSNYRFMEGDDVNNRWRIYDRVSGIETSRKSVSRTISSATWYHVQVTQASDGTVTMYVGGVNLGSYKFASAVTGLVGCGYNASNSDFDNFCVKASVGTSGTSQEPIEEVVGPKTQQPSIAFAQNRPDPFSGGTTISFSLSEAGRVTLEVYSVSGQRIATLADGVMGAGTHEVSWNATSDSGAEVASGVYFYRIVVSGESACIRKMVLAR